LSDTDADLYTSLRSATVFRQFQTSLSPAGLSGRKRQGGKPILTATRASPTWKRPLESVASQDLHRIS